jgi:tRNA(Ile)-lysidine synthase
MQEAFLKHIDQNRLCTKQDRIVLAVSGGQDSMVMLHLFASQQFNVSVAHCNFQLRGDESDGDEIFVSQRCKQLRVPFFSKRFNTLVYAEEKGISIQMAARELRYTWFAELMQQEQFTRLATAHHLSDSVETILFNLVNGRGLDGTMGIVLSHDGTIRPLLFATRNEIEAFAIDHSITWREDSSNAEVDYKRNFIRHEIIPRLKEVNPNLELSVLRGVEKNKGIMELKSLGLADFELKHVVRSSSRISIAKGAFERFQYPASVLYELIKPHGFSFEQCGQVISALHGQPGKRFITSSHLLVVDRDQLIIDASAEAMDEVIIEGCRVKMNFGSWQLEIEESNDLTPKVDPFYVSLDADLVKFPLTWRLWREGDYFYPLGMNGRKKISDFLIDQKVSLSDKTMVSVIESAGEIVWVAGYRISDRFKITSRTRRALHFLLTPHFV